VVVIVPVVVVVHMDIRPAIPPVVPVAMAVVRMSVIAVMPDT